MCIMKATKTPMRMVATRANLTGKKHIKERGPSDGNLTRHDQGGKREILRKGGDLL